MNIVVGTTPIVLLPVTEGASTVLIQNLGSGALYVDGNHAVTTATGVKIPANTSLTIPGPDIIGSIYLVADAASTDVRYLA